MRTLLPLGLLVVTFGIVGQIGYSQVTESLTRGQNAEVARLEAARVSDYLLDTTRALRQFVSSPVLISADASQVFNSSRDELIGQQFDLVQVSDPGGRVRAASDGSRGGSLLNPKALESLKTGDLSMALARGKMKNGREAVV